MLQRLFGLEAHGTTVRTEFLAGLTTFVTMAYIVVVNPLILGDAGMPIAGVAVATCVAAGFGSILMDCCPIILWRWRRAWVSTPTLPTPS